MLKALSCTAGSSAVQQANFATGPLSCVATFSGWESGGWGRLVLAGGGARKQLKMLVRVRVGAKAENSSGILV